MIISILHLYSNSFYWRLALFVAYAYGPTAILAIYGVEWSIPEKNIEDVAQMR